MPVPLPNAPAISVLPRCMRPVPMSMMTRPPRRGGDRDARRCCRRSGWCRGPARGSSRARPRTGSSCVPQRDLEALVRADELERARCCAATTSRYCARIASFSSSERSGAWWNRHSCLTPASRAIAIASSGCEWPQCGRSRYSSVRELGVVDQEVGVLRERDDAGAHLRELGGDRRAAAARRATARCA